MATKVEADLRELLRIREDPRFVEVSKWERSMPQYEVGHLDRMNEIDTLAAKLPGLALAGNSYRGAGIPDCIRSGESAAETLLS
jgi:oxygen-dependent protoporphyrinogen oxidase